MKECVVILGMHRSGTSVLTGLVSFFGGYIGAELMPATKDNPKGYFENNRIYVLNEKILRENNASWDDYSFIVETIDDAVFQNYVVEAKAIIQDELKFVKKTLIKDPRICILFPIWEQALNELNIKIKIIFAYRSPLEVAHSLLKRDKIAVEKGLMLWSHHFLQSELYSRKYPRLVVEYDADFKDLPHFLEIIADFVDEEVTDEVVSKANEFYTPSLKHHQVTLDNVSEDLPAYLKDLVNILITKKLNSKKKLDCIRDEFNFSRRFYLYNEKNLLQSIAEKEQTLSQLEQQLEQQRHELEAQLVTKDEQLVSSHEEARRVQQALNAQVVESAQQESKLRETIVGHEQSLKQLNSETESQAEYLAQSEKIFQSLIGNKQSYLQLHKNVGSVTTLKRRKRLSIFSKKKKRLLQEKQLIIESGLFSAHYYFSRYPDIWQAGVDPLAHYCNTGWKEGRQPSADFDVARYQDKYPEVLKTNINPLLHFIRSGAMQVSPTKLEDKPLVTLSSNKLKAAFDASYYLSHNPDVAEKNLDPYQHFIEHGWKENRDPSADFSTQFYLDSNPDVRKSGVNPLQHYVQKGQAEKRAPKLLGTRTIAAIGSSPSILFVGHSAAQGGAEVVLLDIIQWYAENTTYQIQILLLAPGILAGEFMKYGKVLTLNSADELTEQTTQSFLAFHYDLIYLNTVVSGVFGKIYQQKYAKLATPIVLHVHEMQNIIELYKESFDAIVDNVDLFITASTRVKDDLLEHHDLDAKKISVHHSFVQNKAENSSQLARQVASAREHFKLADDDFVIMGSGTVNWRKGPDIFVDTLIKTIKQYRGKNIIGIWMGAGEDLEVLQQQVDEANLSENIIFTGFVKNASELVAAADLFFLSSREDPFPLVCLEAAQFNVPTACFNDATGMVEFIKDDAGLAIAEMDAGVAANEIISLIQDEAQREQYGFTARARFMQSYRSEHQIKSIFHTLKKRYGFNPSLSTIIPNYNHADYLGERINSVIQQNFYDQEVLILDDASSDNSLMVIAEYKQDPRVRLLANKKCSGSPFKQWKKGIKAAKSEFIWIAESDDSCSGNFISTLLPAFSDSNTVLSYCRSEIIDEQGTHIPNALTPYMERAHPTKFKDDYTRDGNKEVEENFAVACTIVNGSSVIFKKAAVKDSLTKAMQFKMCGDWLIYLQALFNGKIAYTTQATNFFRRHQTSTVHKVEGTDLYFKERFEISKEVLNQFNVSEPVFNRMLSEVDSEWERFKSVEKSLSYEELYDKSALKQQYAKQHVAPMKVGLYVHGFMFSKGGIERLAADLANYLSNRGHQVVIFCRVFKGDAPIYQVNQDVQVIPVFDESKKQLKLATARLREALESEQLDVFVPMLSEWIFEPVIEAAEGLGFPIVASEHNNPEVIEQQWWSHEKRVATFEKTHLIHLLRDNYKTSLPDNLQQKIQVIQNGSYLGKWFERDFNKTFKRIIAVGRLAPQKRFDRLIKAFALVVDQVDKDWQLDIYGEGPADKELQALIEQLGLEQRVTLKGNSHHIEREYRSSDLFVIPSKFEGDPVVLVEAKMFGLPCIGYSDCPGANEAIQHESDGLLVDTDEAGENLSKAILRLLNDEQQRQQFGAAAKQHALPLDMNHIASEWEKMLSKLLGAK